MKTAMLWGPGNPPTMILPTPKFHTGRATQFTGTLATLFEFAIYPNNTPLSLLKDMDILFVISWSMDTAPDLLTRIRQETKAKSVVVWDPNYSYLELGYGAQYLPILRSYSGADAYLTWEELNAGLVQELFQRPAMSVRSIGYFEPLRGMRKSREEKLRDPYLFSFGKHMSVASLLVAMRALQEEGLSWKVKIHLPTGDIAEYRQRLEWAAQEHHFPHLEIIEGELPWIPKFLPLVAGAYANILMDSRCQCGRLSGDGAIVGTPTVAAVSWERQPKLWPELCIPGNMYVSDAISKLRSLLRHPNYEQLCDDAWIANEAWSGWAQNKDRIYQGVKGMLGL